MCGKLKFEFQKHGIKVSALKLGFEKNFETWYGLDRMFQV